MSSRDKQIEVAKLTGEGMLYGWVEDGIVYFRATCGDTGSATPAFLREAVRELRVGRQGPEYRVGFADGWLSWWTTRSDTPRPYVEIGSYRGGSATIWDSDLPGVADQLEALATEAENLTVPTAPARPPLFTVETVEEDPEPPPPIGEVVVFRGGHSTVVLARDSDGDVMVFPGSSDPSTPTFYVRAAEVDDFAAALRRVGDLDTFGDRDSDAWRDFLDQF